MSEVALKRIKSVLKRIVLALIPPLGKNETSGSKVPRIVVLVNWENLGDFVLFSSVIRETRKNFPHSRLFVVAQKENSNLVEFCPYVDHWIWVKGHQKAKSGQGHGKTTSYERKMFSTYIELLRRGKGKIDILIGPDWLLVEDPKHFTENFLFKHVNKDRNLLEQTALQNYEVFVDHSHQVDRMLSVLKMYGLEVNNNEIENWTISKSRVTQVIHNKPSSKKHILISLGAGQVRRNWPIEKVSTLIGFIIEEYPDLEITILGPPSFDSPMLANIFVNSKNLTNLIGKTSLSEITHLMLSADLLVSNDSGLAHLAATVKLPCVVVSAHPLNGSPWHLHSPNRYHPWQTKYIELQPKFLLSPCAGSCQADSPHCITTIEPQEVLQACRTMLIQS